MAIILSPTDRNILAVRVARVVPVMVEIRDREHRLVGEVEGQLKLRHGLAPFLLSNSTKLSNFGWQSSWLQMCVIGRHDKRQLSRVSWHLIPNSIDRYTT
ncbi:protein of unknown function (plasmid) [Rhodovastum atsumiense]|nr:protein of unknown function [Rhodovastum atsumiense]